MDNVTGFTNLFRQTTDVSIQSGLTYASLRKLRETMEVLICITLKENFTILYKFSLFQTQENTTFCYWYHREVFTLTRKIYSPSHWNYHKVNDNWLSYLERKKKKAEVEKTVPVPKGRKPTLIPAEMKMVAAALLLQKTPQSFENYLKGRDSVCMVLPYPFSDIAIQHSTTTELFYMLILKICHTINTVDPIFVN